MTSPCSCPVSGGATTKNASGEQFPDAQCDSAVVHPSTTSPQASLGGVGEPVGVDVGAGDRVGMRVGQDSQSMSTKTLATARRTSQVPPMSSPP